MPAMTQSLQMNSPNEDSGLALKLSLMVVGETNHLPFTCTKTKVLYSLTNNHIRLPPIEIESEGTAHTDGKNILLVFIV